MNACVSDYCHLCDSEPCYCGRHGKVEALGSQAASSRGGPRGQDPAIRQFVLDRYDRGVLRNWDGWLDLLADHFKDDKKALRGAWERVSNELQRSWILIDVPGGELRTPSQYPHMRHLSIPETVCEIEVVIANGGWTTADKGLRAHQVQERLDDVVFVSVYDALHQMNDRDHLITTVAPSGKNSMFWYVRRP